jgi:ABC-type dipeptide/oligopeptide/nickel transport system permease subunit
MSVEAQLRTLPSIRGTSAPVRTLAWFGRFARRKPLGFASLILVVVIASAGLVAPLAAPHHPADNRAGPRLRSYCLGPKDTFLCPTVVERSQLAGERTVEGTLSTPFGTDQLGRDNFSRVLYGARYAMYVALSAVALSTAIAVLVGVPAAYFGRWYDAVVQRFVDAVMSLPVLVILLASVTLLGGASFEKLIVVLGIVGGISGSRVIRSAALVVVNSAYVEAARSIGASNLRIMARHVVPNVFAPIMVQATIGIGNVILAEAALSFLGFGVIDPDRPTWGQLLQQAQQVASVRPDQLVWPALALSAAVFGFNMLGDALRDLLDPRLRTG